METSLDLSRWREAPKGVGYRRWTIMATGLRHLLRSRFFPALLVGAWLAGLFIAVAGFLFVQSVASGGWLEDFAARFGPRAEAVVTTFGGLVVLYPDICIDALFTEIFYVHSFVGAGLSLIALTIMVPQLVARDRASNALTIYLSRPLTSTDYLLGKLGMIVGVLVLTWTGPLVVGWALSMLMAPDRDFLVYSFMPLLHALLFNGIALVVMAAIALGVSALTRSARLTIVIWIAMWLVAGTVAKIPEAPVWLSRASFSHDLGQIRQDVFHLDEALDNAATKLPILNQQFVKNLKSTGEKAAATDFKGALIGLAALTALSCVVFFRKLRPE